MMVYAYIGYVCVCAECSRAWQPAPKRIDFAESIARWCKGKFSTEDLAMDKIWADNNPEKPVIFNPTTHRKYNAQV